VIALSVCASHFTEQRPENDTNSQENASQAADSARKDKLPLLDCLREYATKTGQLPLPATEIAEAAVGDRKCRVSLINYEMNV